MLEDRYLRDSAKALVEADLEHVKTDLARKGLVARTFDTVKDGAVDLYEEAVDAAEDNKGALVALVAAVVVWFARNPLLDLFGLGEGDDAREDDAEPAER
jgi:hypothetical protein